MGDNREPLQPRVERLEAEVADLREQVASTRRHLADLIPILQAVADGDPMQPVDLWNPPGNGE